MDSRIHVNQVSADRDGQTLQSQIISHMDPELYKIASEGNFDAFHNHLDELGDLLTPKNNTILHVYITAQTKLKLTNDSKKLMQQSLSSRHRFLKQVLNRCPSLLTKANIKNETPLHIAARYGHYDVILVLAAAHDQDTETGVLSNFWRMMSVTNETALHEAARNNHLHVVKLLLEKDPELINMCNYAGEPPLYVATERGYREVASMILESCSSAAAYDGPNKRTVLHAAVTTMDAVMTERILKKTSELTRRVDKEGWTPLHYASFFPHPKLVELLLKFDKSAAYIKDIYGRTPLLVAASRRRGLADQKLSAEAIKLIISECPDCCELVDQNDRNVLHLAAESFNDPAMLALLQAPCLFNLINEKDNEGNTPFLVLANVGFNCKHLVRHSLLDSMVVNDRDFTAVDTIQTADFEYRKEKSELLRTIREVNKCWASWRGKLQMEPLEKVLGRIDKMTNTYKKGAESHLIVATLIATVTFAAGFTLPGGYENDDPKKRGYAVLSKRFAFKVFVLTDSITLALSMFVIFIHLLLPVQGHRKKFYRLYDLASQILPYALWTMALAFLTGLYAVLPHSYAVAIVDIVITAIAIVVSFIILLFTRFYLMKPGDEIILWW